MRLKGKTAFVTGANRGIGNELSRQLADEGARLYLGVRQNHRELSQKFENAAVVLIDTSQTESVLKAIENLPGPVDILVNNAAVLDHGSIFSLDDRELETVIRTNLLGPVLLSKHLAAGMQKRKWGRIVNVTSGMGAITSGLGSDSTAYRITKLALNGFTLCLADALRGTGVLVNSVDPGWVRTKMGGSAASRTVEQGAHSIMHAILLPDDGPSGLFFRDGRKADW